MARIELLSDTGILAFNIPCFVNPTAEMISIYQCLLALPTSHTTIFRIYTDSKASSLKLQSVNLNCKIASNILFLLHHLYSNGVCITFLWSPAHRDIPSVEIANQNAEHTVSSFQPYPLRIYAYIYSNYTIINGYKTSKHNPANWQSEVATNFILTGHTRLTHTPTYSKNVHCSSAHAYRNIK